MPRATFALLSLLAARASANKDIDAQLQSLANSLQAHHERFEHGLKQLAHEESTYWCISGVPTTAYPDCGPCGNSTSLNGTACNYRCIGTHGCARPPSAPPPPGGGPCRSWCDPVLYGARHARHRTPSTHTTRRATLCSHACTFCGSSQVATRGMIATVADARSIATCNKNNTKSHSTGSSV